MLQYISELLHFYNFSLFISNFNLRFFCKFFQFIRCDLAWIVQTGEKLCFIRRKISYFFHQIYSFFIWFNSDIKFMSLINRVLSDNYKIIEFCKFNFLLQYWKILSPCSICLLIAEIEISYVSAIRIIQCHDFKQSTFISSLFIVISSPFHVS